MFLWCVVTVPVSSCKAGQMASIFCLLGMRHNAARTGKPLLAAAHGTAAVAIITMDHVSVDTRLAMLGRLEAGAAELWEEVRCACV